MLPRIARTVPVAALTLCILIPSLGSGQVPGVPQPYPPSSAKTEAIALASGAAIGIGILYLAKSAPEHHLKGCVLDGMRLQGLGERPKIYSLQGEFPPVKIGEFVLLSGYLGPRVKKGEVRFFKVTRVESLYRTCPAQPANSH